MKKGAEIKKRQGAEKFQTLIITNKSDTSTKPSADSGTGQGNSNQIPIRNK